MRVMHNSLVKNLQDSHSYTKVMVLKNYGYTLMRHDEHRLEG
jgi:hypothetical protein